MTLRELKTKREAVLCLAKKHGAHNVRVFGSVIRDEAGTESDVDIIVGMERGRSLLDLIAFEQDLENLLECKVDLITDEGISPYLKDRIYDEAKAL